MKLRNQKRVNYLDLHTGDQVMDEHFQINADEENSVTSEEGEILEESENEDKWILLSEEDFSEEVQQAIQEADEEKLEFLFKMKEKRCSRLRMELDKNSKEERAKRRRMREWEEKFSKLNQTEANLNRSLVNSRDNTPKQSPTRSKAAPVKSSSGPKTGGGAKRKTTAGSSSSRSVPEPKKRAQKLDFSTDRETRGECDFLLPETSSLNPNSLLKSILELKQGNSQAFSELIGKAAEASHNIEILKGNCSAEKPPIVSNSKLAGMLNQYKEGSNKQKVLTDVSGEDGRQHLIKMLSEFQHSDNVKPADNDNSELLTAINNLTTQLKEMGIKTSGEEKEEKESKKKLLSGKTTKPDEADIKKQIKFAHQKLDPRHAKERVFEKLTFPLLVAGELELALQDNISEEERRARVGIAKTICYHRKYLSEDELKIGYDIILKSVEQGQADWSSALQEDLHKFYDYRAMAILREKNTSGMSEDRKRPAFQGSPKDQESKEEDEAPMADDTGKIIYCLDFNNGKCSHDKAHAGKWKGKKVMKWHICKNCIRKGKIQQHKDSDPECKNKE